MSFNPAILDEALQARALTKSRLAQRLKIGADQLKQELERDPAPRQGLLNDIAKELAIPPFAFFKEKEPTFGSALPDFRSSVPRQSPKSSKTIQVIEMARSIQAEAVEKFPESTFSFGLTRSDAIKNISSFALETREKIGIALNDQVNAKDAGNFYAICRQKIEKAGIFVLHDSFPEEDGSGFCLAHATHPLIVVNTKKQGRGRRLFTLAHELCHVLLGETGVSDPFVNENAVERFCNQFAAEFLVPPSYADALLKNVTVPTSPDLDDIRLIARKLKISQQATVLRLQELDLIDQGSYENWLTLIHNIGNPDFSDPGGGGGKTPQEKVKLAKYGFRFAELFGKLHNRGQIPPIVLYRLCGLKPQYAGSYFDYAASLSEEELADLSFSDE